MSEHETEAPMHSSLKRLALEAAARHREAQKAAAGVILCDCHGHTLLQAHEEAVRENYHRAVRAAAEEGPDIPRILGRLGAGDVHIHRLAAGRYEKRPPLQAARLWWAFREVERPPLLSLLGPTDDGKTFAAVWALAKWAGTWPWNSTAGGSNVTEEPAFFVRTKALADNAFSDAWAGRAKRARFLVLDEVGGENLNGPAESMLHELIDTRYAFRRYTVLTANLSLAAFEARYDGERPKAFADRPGRLTRRILEQGVVLNGRTLLIGGEQHSVFP